MLTETSCSTCYGTLFLVQEITVITVITMTTFDKTQMTKCLPKHFDLMAMNTIGFFVFKTYLTFLYKN